jgi:hypothetical protein
MDKIFIKFKQITPYCDLAVKLRNDLGALDEDAEVSFREIYKLGGFKAVMYCLSQFEGTENQVLITHFGLDICGYITGLCMEEIRELFDKPEKKHNFDKNEYSNTLLADVRGRTDSKVRPLRAAASILYNIEGTAYFSHMLGRLGEIVGYIGEYAIMELLFEYCRLGERPKNSYEIISKAEDAEQFKIMKKIGLYIIAIAFLVIFMFVANSYIQSRG